LAHYTLPISHSPTLRPGERKIQEERSNNNSISDVPVEEGISLRVAELCCLIIGQLPSFDLDVDTQVIPILNEFLKEVKKSKQEKNLPKNIAFFLIPGFILLSAFCLAAAPFFSLTTCPDGFEHFLSLKGNCYYVSNSSVGHRSLAQKQCEERNGTLVEIYIKEELRNVESNLKHMNLTDRHFWIGLIRRPISPFIQNLTQWQQKSNKKNLTGGFQGHWKCKCLVTPG
jgi:hypothetical protein